MLIIESKKFLLPVFWFSNPEEEWSAIAYYNSKTKTLLSRDKYSIKDFERIKEGLGNIYRIDRENNKYRILGTKIFIATGI